MRRRASILALATAAALAQEDKYWHGESIQPIHVVIAANRAQGAPRGSPIEDRPPAKAVRTNGGARAEVGARRRGVMY